MAGSPRFIARPFSSTVGVMLPERTGHYDVITQHTAKLLFYIIYRSEKEHAHTVLDDLKCHTCLIQPMGPPN